MPTTKSWLHRMFGKPDNGTPPVSESPPILTGIYQERGRWRLCRRDEEKKGRVVYLISIPAKLLEDYAVNLPEYQRIQKELSAIPRTLRPRRKRMPDLGTAPVDG